MSATSERRRSTLADRASQQEVPEFADWIPDPATSPTASRLRGVWRYEMAATLAGQGEDAGDYSDPMLMNPISVGAVSVFLWSELDQVGLAEPIVGPAMREGAAPEDVPADRGLVIGQAQVYLGSFDESALESAISEGAFSETDTDGLYEHDEQELFVQATSTPSAVVVAPTAEQARTLVATKNGDVDRRYEVDSDFEWLLRTAGRGDFTVALLSEGDTVQLNGQDDFSDYSMFEGSKGFAQSVSLEGGGLVSATTGVVYAGGDRVDLDRLESTLGTEATDSTVEQDDRYVTLNGSYDLDQGPSDGGNNTETPPPDDGTETPPPDQGTETPPPDDGTEMPPDDGTEAPPDDGTDPTDTATTDEGSPGMGLLATLASLGAVGYRFARQRDGGGEQ